MKPREELRDVVWKTVTSDVLSLKDKATRITQHCDQLAIGRWVSVEERLPEFRANYWCGYMVDDGRIEYDIRSEATFKSGDITHWLELDIPEVEQ